jgi:hypothetical protein
MRVCFIVDLMARREITEAEQQRLDRHKQRRDEYIRELAGLAPPLSEDQAAKLVRCARPTPRTHAAPAPQPHRVPPPQVLADPAGLQPPCPPVVTNRPLRDAQQVADQLAESMRFDPGVPVRDGARRLRAACSARAG